MNNTTQQIELHEGCHILFPAHAEVLPHQLLGLAWASSAMLQGKPVRCVGFLPGVTLQIHTSLDIVVLAQVLEDGCTKALASLREWIDRTEQEPCAWLPLPHTHAIVTVDPQTWLPPAAIEIERRYPWHFHG